MPYNAGDAYLRIIPTFRGVAQTINAEAKKWGATAGKSFSDDFNTVANQQTSQAEIGPSAAKSGKAGDDSGDAFARAFRARVEAALRAMPDVDIDANSSDVDRTIAEIRTRLAALRDARIDVDIDAGTALAEVQAIKADIDALAARSPSVRVDVDAARASAELAAIQGQVTALGAEDVSVQADDSGISRYTSRLGGLAAAIVAVLGVAGPLAGALSAIGAAAATSLGAVVGAAGVGILGFSGLSDATDLLQQRQKALSAANSKSASSMTSAANSANQLRDAQARLTNARADAADAEIESAQRVTDAQKTLVTVEEDAAQQAQDSARKISDARRSLADVQQSSADRLTSAARSVQTAEERLADAQRTALQAQQDLNDAREQAARDLEDYANKAIDANLAVRAAQLDLASAQKRQTDLTGGQQGSILTVQQAQMKLAEAQAKVAADQLDSSKSALEIHRDELDVQYAMAALDAAQKQQSADPNAAASAALAVDQAQQRLAEAQLNSQRATEQNNAAQKAGVAGAPGVVQAQQRIADSAEKTKDAQQSLTDAQHAQVETQRQAARDIADAQQKITDARADAADAARQSADRITSAQRSVADALRQQESQQRHSAASIQSAQSAVASALTRVGTAATGAGSAGASSLASIDAQLAKINPLTLTLARFVEDKLKPAFQHLKDTAAASLAPGLLAGFGALSTMQPQLESFVTSVASTLGGMFDDMAVALGGPFWSRFFNYVTDNTPGILRTLGSIGGNLAKAFAGVMMAFQPLTDTILGAINTWSAGFADFATGSGIQKFVQYVKDTGPAVASALGSAIDMALHLMDAFTPLGMAILDTVSYISDLVSSLSPDQLSVAIAGIGLLAAAFGGPTTMVIGLVLAVAGAVNLIKSHWSTIQPVIQPVLDQFAALGAFISDKLVPVLRGILIKAWQGVRSAFESVSAAVARNRDWIDKLVDGLKIFYSFVVTKVLPLLGPIMKASWTATGKIIGTIIDIIGSLVDVGKGVVRFFKDVFTGNWSNLWSDLRSTVRAALDVITGWFIGIGQDIWDSLGQAKDKLLSSGQRIIDWVSDGVTGGWSDTKDWFGKIGAHIWDAISGAAGEITGYGKKIIGWIYSGVAGGWSATASWLGGIASRIWSAIKGSAARVTGFGSNIMGWIRSGISSGWSSVSDWLAGIPSRIWSVIKTFTTSIVGFGKSIIGWIRNGIGSGWTDIKTWFGGLGDRVWAAIRGAQSGITGFGRDIIGWIRDGVVSSVSLIKSGMKVALNAVIDVVNGFIRSFNNISGGLSKVWSWAHIPGIPKIDEIQHFAQGGMVDGPTLAMLGDNPSHREVALPLDSPGTISALASALRQAASSVNISATPARQAPLIGSVHLAQQVNPFDAARELDRILVFTGGI